MAEGAGLRVREPEEGASAGEGTPYKPGVVYRLKDGKPEPTRLLTGLSDGASIEVQSDEIKPGDQVVVGLDLPAGAARAMQPPPGMGGMMFGGPRPGGGGGGRGPGGGGGGGSRGGR